MADFRKLPKVDDLASHPDLASFGPRLRVEGARFAVQQLRGEIQRGEAPDFNSSSQLAFQHIQNLCGSDLVPVINMSGVILHTGLGRARLAAPALEAIRAAAEGHSEVEFDLATGKRGDRQEHVRSLLRFLTGAEDALVVNNAAAALVLTLRALANRREVLLSRGQFVEIGGSFRVSEIAAEGGCKIRDVGTTNRTRVDDYAVTDKTTAILVCHKSNFQIVGHVAEPGLAELATIGVPLIHDQGTGCLLDFTTYGIQAGISLPESISSGADVSIGSGDKLLGGPQAGIIIGKKVWLDKIKRHPLARAMRVDKLTLAALRSTLLLYANGREQEIPTVRYITRPLSEVESLAQKLKAASTNAILEPSVCEVGGGTGPDVQVPSFRIGLQSRSAQKLAKTFREQIPAVIGRVERDRFWLDPRAAEESEVDTVASIIRKCCP